MLINLSKEAKEYLLGVIEKRAEENPFMKEDERTFIKYDSTAITVNNNIMTITYIWKGIDMFTISEKYHNGDVLTIRDLSGKMQLTLG